MCSTDNISEPLVTVVIPYYNAKKWIRETLDSVLQQTYQNLEILVVDDGSPDDGALIVEAIAQTDSRVRLLRKVNGGVGSARNLGIEMAQGEFIAPLDADDVWMPEKIEQQVRRYRAVKDMGLPIGMVYCWSQDIDEQSLVTAPGFPRHPKEGDVFDALFAENFVGNGSSPLFETLIIREIGGYKEDMPTGCEDWLLYLEVANHYHLYAVPEYLVGYRQVSNSMSKASAVMEEAHASAIEYITAHCRSLRSGQVRDSRTVLLLWMLAQSQLFSESFYYLLKQTWRNDPLFLVRWVTLMRMKTMIRSRSIRLWWRIRGISFRYDFITKATVRD